MARFFFPFHASDYQLGHTLTLPSKVAQHVLVRRHRMGDALVLFNGHGDALRGRITVLDKRAVGVCLDSITHETPETQLHLTLVQALPCSDKLEWLLQKAVELGVQDIHLLAAERSTLKITADKEASKMARWQDIIISACEQSGRYHRPTLHPIQSVSAFLSDPQHTQTLAKATRLCLHPHAAHGLGDLARNDHFAFLVGPEGGFSPTEYQRIADAQWQGVQLGPRVLRTETAGMVISSVLHARFGDFAP